jgi:FAD/FMN-containing dehydrogenase
MLIELNKKLFEQGYHCPALCGCLPFMSFAGGLSTNSHTSYSFLADLVEGIELLLPSGKKRYVRKGDSDFNLLCNHPSFGLLGVITGIDIKVKKGAKKIKRSIKYSTYAQLAPTVAKDAKAADPNANHHGSPNGRAIIFSPARMNGNTKIKMTAWEWVGADLADSGTIERQSSLPSYAAKASSQFAISHPRTMSSFFEATTLRDSQAGTVVRQAQEVMGPESSIAGALTEMGLFFEYDEQKLELFLRKMEALFQQRHLQRIHPVNTAIFIRFPKKGDRFQVAIDFASLGLNLKEMQPFVEELMRYLQEKICVPSYIMVKAMGSALTNNFKDKPGMD